jgi:hypothetical protein
LLEELSHERRFAGLQFELARGRNQRANVMRSSADPAKSAH